eukprot:m.1076770 g.1076770  ORF g.1076770 m.1076770 type:complete len:55 (-) comp24248_c0_seq5:260-424(-)
MAPEGQYSLHHAPRGFLSAYVSMKDSCFKLHKQHDIAVPRQKQQGPLWPSQGCH